MHVLLTGIPLRFAVKEPFDISGSHLTNRRLLSVTPIIRLPN